MMDVIYSLAAEETKEGREARERLDAHLLSQAVATGNGGKPDRATWGRLPHQQAAMKAAEAAVQ